MVGGIPPELARDLWLAQDKKCLYCEQSIDIHVTIRSNGGRDSCTLDHVFPRSSMGQRLANNIVLAHARCNTQKADRAPTADEISRAARVYRRIGRVAFQLIPPNWKPAKGWKKR